MKRKLLLVSVAALIIFSASKVMAQSKKAITPHNLKNKTTLYFSPEVFPNIEEIKQPTNEAFFTAISDRTANQKNNHMLAGDISLVFDSISPDSIVEYCRNNNADFAIVPKVKYFKVGLGKYIFSNQVVVSMKLFDKNGNFLTESTYDTYKKNMRLLGKAENSIKIGTEGAMKALLRNLRNKGNSPDLSF